MKDSNVHPYKHVHDKFRHLVSSSEQRRIDFLNEQRWVNYDVADRIMKMLLELMKHPKKPRMLNLLIVGDSNNGKTTLIRRFYEEHGSAYVNSDCNAVRPIIIAEAPTTASEKELYISIIERFAVPYSATAPIAKLRFQVVHLCREFHVNMLIIDEIHSLLTGSPKQQKQIMNAIKTLCNELQIPIVGVGTKPAIQVLHIDPQHASRFDVAELPTWKLDKNFQKLLFQFEGILPLKIASKIYKSDKATKIHVISGGNLGNVHRLLIECTKEAISTGKEEITMDIIKKFSWLQPTKGVRKLAY